MGVHRMFLKQQYWDNAFLSERFTPATLIGRITVKARTSNRPLFVTSLLEYEEGVRTPRPATLQAALDYIYIGSLGTGLLSKDEAVVTRNRELSQADWEIESAAALVK